jgi:hypothetical protein
MGSPQDVPEGLPRHTHAAGGVFLVKTLDVRQPQRLDFVRRQDDFFKLAERYPAGFEIGGVGETINDTGFGRSRHAQVFLN